MKPAAESIMTFKWKPGVKGSNNHKKFKKFHY